MRSSHWSCGCAPGTQCLRCPPPHGSAGPGTHTWPWGPVRHSTLGFSLEAAGTQNGSSLAGCRIGATVLPLPVRSPCSDCLAPLVYDGVYRKGGMLSGFGCPGFCMHSNLAPVAYQGPKNTLDGAPQTLLTKRKRANLSVLLRVRRSRGAWKGKSHSTNLVWYTLLHFIDSVYQWSWLCSVYACIQMIDFIGSFATKEPVERVGRVRPRVKSDTTVFHCPPLPASVLLHSF